MEIPEPIQQLMEQHPELKVFVELLLDRIDRLEKRLSLYENSNTPPSQRRFFPKPKSRSNGKPGRKEGHQGTTRPQAEPDRTVEVTASECPHCKSKLRLMRVERRVIEDLPIVREKIVTEFLVSHYHCGKCGMEVVPSHPDLPKTGRFGKGITAETTTMKFCDRLTYDKIAGSLARHGIDMSSATILDLARRATNAMRPEYEAIMKRIRNAEVVYSDETGLKVGGKGCWIWVFVSGNDVLVVVANSRSKRVIESALGKDFSGIIVCDGWKPYSSFTNRIQRCWAHLLREADGLAEDKKGRQAGEEAKRLDNELHSIFDECKEMLKDNPPPDIRERIHTAMTARMKRLVEMDYQSESAKKFVQKIANGFDYWFTFVLNPGVEPTNNIAEGTIREHVVHRKIIGTLRNEKGMRIHETAMSVFQTQQNMGLNPFEELLKVL